MKKNWVKILFGVLFVATSVAVAGAQCTVYEMTTARKFVSMTFDGVVGVKESALENVDTDGDFYLEATILSICSDTDPADRIIIIKGKANFPLFSLLFDVDSLFWKTTVIVPSSYMLWNNGDTMLWNNGDKMLWNE